MKKLAIIFLLISQFCFSQLHLFASEINENTLSNANKISKAMAKTYYYTKYFYQTPFNLQDNYIINLPSGRKIEAQFSKKYSYTNHSESFVYKIKNEHDSEMVFSIYDGIVTGMYASANGEKVIFQQTSATIFALSEVNESILINQDNKNDNVILDSSLLNGNKNVLTNANICLDTTPVCSATTIDVLVVFTADAKTAYGGLSQSHSFIATAITNFNTALQNSGVNHVNINLAYSGEIAYVESGDLSVDLPRLRNQTDGFMDDVHTLRTTYGADLCALITSTPTNTCGLGYLNTNSTNYNNSIAFTTTVFSCVVSNYSLSHEMGHNMGLNHDWYVSTSTSPCTHQHGYVNQTAIIAGTTSTSSQRWRTIMAYNDQCSATGFNCTRRNFWANPDVNYNSDPTGKPLTDAQPSNEAFGFMRFACVVSQFMPTSQLATLETKNENEFTLFPNPANEFIQINSSKKQNYYFEVVNVLGQVLKTSNENKISVKGFTKGEYFLIIYNKEKTYLETKKFLVD